MKSCFNQPRHFVRSALFSSFLIPVRHLHIWRTARVEHSPARYSAAPKQHQRPQRGSFHHRQLRLAHPRGPPQRPRAVRPATPRAFCPRSVGGRGRSGREGRQREGSPGALAAVGLRLRPGPLRTRPARGYRLGRGRPNRAGGVCGGGARVRYRLIGGVGDGRRRADPSETTGTPVRRHACTLVADGGPVRHLQHNIRSRHHVASARPRMPAPARPALRTLGVRIDSSAGRGSQAEAPAGR